jgi:hypothetical protein
MKTAGFSTEITERTTFHSGSIDLEIEQGDETQEVNVGFTIIEMYDENSDSTTFDVTFVDGSEGLDEEELKKVILDEFNKQ